MFTTVFPSPSVQVFYSPRSMGAPSLRLPGGLTLAEVLRRWDAHDAAFSTPPVSEKRDVRRRRAAERRWATSPADDDTELAALRALGGRRRRRALQDGLLRDLAGSLDAADVAGLFAPVPFGGPPRETVFAQLHGREELLVAFMGRLEEQAPERPPRPCLSAEATAWARVSRSGRLALRSLSSARLHELESELRGGETELEVRGDAYARLVAHALSAWLGYLPVSTVLNGERVVLVQRGGAISPPPVLLVNWLRDEGLGMAAPPSYNGEQL